MELNISEEKCSGFICFIYFGYKFFLLWIVKLAYKEQLYFTRFFILSENSNKKSVGLVLRNITLSRIFVRVV